MGGSQKIKLDENILNTPFSRSSYEIPRVNENPQTLNFQSKFSDTVPHLPYFTTKLQYTTPLEEVLFNFSQK